MHRNTRMNALRVCTLVVENAQHSSDDLTHICQSLSDSSMLQPWARSCRCMVPCYTLGCRKGRPAVNMSACTPHLESQTLPEPQPKHDGENERKGDAASGNATQTSAWTKGAHSRKAEYKLCARALGVGVNNNVSSNSVVD